MRGKVIRLTSILAALVLCAGAVSCAPSSSSGKKAEAGEEPDEQVMYSPPADEDQPTEIPRGAPVLDGYERPTSDAQPAPPEGSDAVGPEATVARATLESLMAQGPAWGLSQIEVSPHRDGDVFKGFAITKFGPIAAGTVSPPLAVGDVITHLNGVRLRKPDDYLEAWKLARTVPAIRVDYIRDGQPSYSSWQVVD